jgi:plastocyanin
MGPFPFVLETESKIMPGPNTSSDRSLGGVATMIALGAFFVATLAAVAVAADGGNDNVSAGSGDASVSVSLSEFAIQPSTVTVPEGGTLTVSNSGSQTHNLEVVDQDKKTRDIEGGGKTELDLDGLEPGTYQVLCAIPGHADSGMTATLVIGEPGSTEGGAEPSAAADQHAGHEMTPADAEKMDADMAAGVQTYLDEAERYGAGDVERGNQLLEPTILPDGTKRFELTAAITDWDVGNGEMVKAWTYNGVVPGPMIKMNPGDKVEVAIQNDLPISTDIHMHGITLDNEDDGVAPITQDPIKSGDSYTYSFTAPASPELGMYHAHHHGHVAIVNGLFAPMQVGEIALPEGRTINGVTVPQGVQLAQQYQMVLNDAGVIGLTLNGKSFPYTEPITAKQGDWLLVNYFNEGLQIHPMHLHRQPHLVVAKDGFPLAEPYRVDTLNVAPGERYSVLIKAEAPGVWAWHCHILNHAENDQGLFGMVTTMIVS